MQRWDPVSISGYLSVRPLHAVQQAAYTLRRGRYPDDGARGFRMNLARAFVFSNADRRIHRLTRVSRSWAIGMRDAFGAGPKAQMFKVHTQTSGRSLIAAEFKNNLTRTAAELMLAYMNGTNSCHSNSADEPFTTPSEEWIRLAAHGQAILLDESGTLSTRWTWRLAG